MFYIVFSSKVLLKSLLHNYVASQTCPPSGWETDPTTGKHYLANAAKTFYEATVDCFQYGAGLPLIKTTHDYNFVSKKIASIGEQKD